MIENVSGRTLDNAAVNEPLVLPATPGEVWVRLSQVRGALPKAHGSFAPAIDEARTALMHSIESGARENIAAQFARAQKLLVEIYNAVQEDDATRRGLGFPTPSEISDSCYIAAPDPKSVFTTFTLNGKQVLTSLAFDRAVGATGYWLHVVRYWEENGETQRVEDPILSSAAPLFERVKFPVGTQILRLKARNTSVSAISEEFSIEVPAL